MNRWFRWYEGTCEDGKFRVVSRNASVTVRDVIALWTFILEDAANTEHRGICQRNEDFMAAVLDFNDGQVEKILERMEEVGLISVGHGAITVCNWGKRQFETDPEDSTNAERQKRYREKRKRNASVTATKRPETDSTDKKEDIDSASARAKIPTIRPEAHDISDSCLLALGFDRRNLPPDWYGLPNKIEMMLARGYDPPNILATFDRLAGQKPLKPMNYFIKAVESSQQNQIKPAGAPNARSGNVVQAAHKLVEHLAYLNQPAPDEARICSGEGKAPLRAISSG